MSGETFRAYALHRALRDVLPALGTRGVLVVADEVPPRVAHAPAPMVVVAARTLALRGNVVRGASARLPVQRAAATGVWFHHALPAGDGADAALAEAARLLQPGGFVVATVRVRLPEMFALAGAAERAGLTVRRRVAVVRDGAAARLPRGLWALSAVAAASSALRASETEPITALLVAELATGTEVDVPDAREMIGSIFVPRRWLKPRRIAR